MEELACHMAWRWFVGLSLNESVWDVTVFTKNRERFLEGDIAQQWLASVVRMLQQRQLIDEEHFSVDATLIGANASERSYQPKADPPQTGSGWGGEVLKRDTHESKTDPDAQLYRKSKRTGFQLAYLGWVRLGLVAAIAGVGPNQRGVHTEVLLVNQLPLLQHSYHRRQPLLRDIPFQKPLPVLGEHRHVPDALVQR